MEISKNTCQVLLRRLPLLINTLAEQIETDKNKMVREFNNCKAGNEFSETLRRQIELIMKKPGDMEALTELYLKLRQICKEGE